MIKRGVHTKLTSMLFAAILLVGMAPFTVQADSIVEAGPVHEASVIERGADGTLGTYASSLEGAEVLRGDEMAGVRGEFVPALYLAAVACAKYCYPAYLAASSAVSIGTGTYLYFQ